MRLLLFLAALPALPLPAAARLELTLVLPSNTDRSAPAEFLLGLASSEIVPRRHVRRARGREDPGLTFRASRRDLPLLPAAASALEAAGLLEITFQLYTEGDVLRLVGSVSLDRAAPRPPLRNGSLRPPAMTGDVAPRAWGVAAVSLDPGRIVPWAVACAERVGEFHGRLLRDAVAVVNLNLGFDIEKGLFGSFAGEVRGSAAYADGMDEARLCAGLRSPEALREALTALAAGSRRLGGRAPRLEPARFGAVEGFRMRLPLGESGPAAGRARGEGPSGGREPGAGRPASGRGAALAFSGRALVLGAPPRLIEEDARGVAESLSPADEDELPQALAEIGPVEKCAAVAVDVLEAARALRRVGRMLRVDDAFLPDPESLHWADGEAALAVRAAGDGLQVWGAWVPRRSTPAFGADSPVAGARSGGDELTRACARCLAAVPDDRGGVAHARHGGRTCESRSRKGEVQRVEYGREPDR